MVSSWPSAAALPGSMNPLAMPTGQGASAGDPPQQPPFNPAVFQSYMQMMYLHLTAQQQQQAGGSMPSMPVPGMGVPTTPYPIAQPPVEPTVRVSVQGMKFQYQLTEDDINKVFKRYGQVKKVSVEENSTSAMVSFETMAEAQAAMSDLDGKVLQGLEGTLRIEWWAAAADSNAAASAAAAAAIAAAAAGASPYPGMGCPPWLFPPAGAGGPWPGVASHPHPSQPSTEPSAAAASSGVEVSDSKGLPTKGTRKYTCRFLIGIENDKEFQVARRLIGSKGSNMKRIVRLTDAKLRLRGQGSGYFEGSGQKESSEPLQLCISCVSEEGYKTAVREVEELLRRIYEEYRQYCRDSGLPAPSLHINFSENQLVYSSRGAVEGAPTDSLGFTGAEASGKKSVGKESNRRRGPAGSKRAAKPSVENSGGP